MFAIRSVLTISNIFANLKKSSKGFNYSNERNAPNTTALNSELEETLNRQLGDELHAAYTYLAMKSFFRHPSVGLDGFAKLQENSIREEWKHADFVANLITLRGGKVIPKSIEPPNMATWTSPVSVLQYALDMEETVLKNLNHLHCLADHHQDYYVCHEIAEHLGEDQIKSIYNLNKYVNLLHNDTHDNILMFLDRYFLKNE